MGIFAKSMSSVNTSLLFARDDRRGQRSRVAWSGFSGVAWREWSRLGIVGSSPNSRVGFV